MSIKDLNWIEIARIEVNPCQKNRFLDLVLQNEINWKYYVKFPMSKKIVLSITYRIAIARYSIAFPHKVTIIRWVFCDENINTIKYRFSGSILQLLTNSLKRCHCTSLGATARSYRRQDGADAAACFEKFLPAHASFRPPISLKFTTEKHGGMVHPVPKRQTRTLSHFCTTTPERCAARRR